MLKFIFRKFKEIWFRLCCFIYNQVIVHPMTKAIYVEYADVLNKKFKGKPYSMLDIGTGTGLPLKEFMKTSNASKVDGIDIDRAYVSMAQKLFEGDKRVNCQYADWFEFAARKNPQKYDIVFFGFSIMLMPNRMKVIADFMGSLGVVVDFALIFSQFSKFFNFLMF